LDVRSQHPMDTFLLGSNDTQQARGASMTNFPSPKFLSNTRPVILSVANFSAVEGPALCGGSDSKITSQQALRTPGTGH
jgi:hypothetical protein